MRDSKRISDTSLRSTRWFERGDSDSFAEASALNVLALHIEIDGIECRFVCLGCVPFWGPKVPTLP